MRRTFCFLMLMGVLTAGCLETREAWPASISDAILKEHGWIISQDVVKQSQTQKIGELTMNVNTATIGYRDDALARDIAAQLAAKSGLTSEEASGASQFSSQLLTVRLVLPGGISIPPEIMNNMLSSQLDQIASQNNIRDFHETGTTTIPLVIGKNVDVKNYEGQIDFEGGSIPIKAMIASWRDADSTIIVFGIMIKEDIVITPQRGGSEITIRINGEQESEEMLTLIQNVT